MDEGVHVRRWSRPWQRGRVPPLFPPLPGQATPPYQLLPVGGLALFVDDALRRQRGVHAEEGGIVELDRVLACAAHGQRVAVCRLGLVDLGLFAPKADVLAVERLG